MWRSIDINLGLVQVWCERRADLREELKVSCSDSFRLYWLVSSAGSKFTVLFLNGAAGASAASEALNSILMLTFTPQAI